MFGPGLHNDWLNLCEPRETDTDSNKWVWLWNLERRGENVSCDLEQSERAALRAQQAVGGIAYQTFQTLPLYSRPSRSSILEDSRLPPGVSVTGFPAQHWIRLAPSNGLDFVSHWVFQHPLDGSLRANWCQLQVSRLPSGTLKVCWPGLPQSHPVIYCLEWDGSKSRGCGLGSSTEACALSNSVHVSFDFHELPMLRADYGGGHGEVHQETPMSLKERTAKEETQSNLNSTNSECSIRNPSILFCCFVCCPGVYIAASRAR